MDNIQHLLDRVADINKKKGIVESEKFLEECKIKIKELSSALEDLINEK